MSDNKKMIKESKYFGLVNQVVDGWKDHFLDEQFESEQKIFDILDGFIKNEGRFDDQIVSLWDTSQQFRREVQKKILSLHDVAHGIKSNKPSYVMKHDSYESEHRPGVKMTRENKDKMIKEQYQGMGKFSSALDELLYAAVLEGWSGEEVGNVSEQGAHYDFIPLEGMESTKELHLNMKEQFEQLTEEEVTELDNARAAIVEESDQGLVSVELFDSKDVAEAKWQEIVESLTGEDDQTAGTEDDDDGELMGEQRHPVKTTLPSGQVIPMPKKAMDRAKEAMKVGGYEDINDIPILDSQVFDWKEIKEIKEWLKQWRKNPEAGQALPHVYSVDTGADYYDFMVTQEELDEDTLVRHNMEEVDAEWTEENLQPIEKTGNDDYEDYEDRLGDFGAGDLPPRRRSGLDEGAIGVGYGQASTCPCKECDEDEEEDKKDKKKVEEVKVTEQDKKDLIEARKQIVKERFSDRYSLGDIDDPDMVRVEDDLDPKNVGDFLPDEGFDPEDEEFLRGSERDPLDDDDMDEEVY